MGPPWHFRLAKSLIQRGVRGPGLWLRLARRAGWLGTATYQLDPFRPPAAPDANSKGNLVPPSAAAPIDVPLDRAENCWDRSEVQSYETSLLDRLAGRMSDDFLKSAALADVGADIGLVPMLLAWRGASFAHVLACEPNPDPRAVLSVNLARLPGTHRVLPLAVADFAGRGRLITPEYDASAHAAYLQPDSAGPIDVITLDELAERGDLPGGNLVVKIDVEGGELAVVRGARRTLARAPRLIVVLEAHPRVAQRSGVDPLEAVRELASLRAIRVEAAERPQTPVDLARPFFQQFPPEIHNLIVESSHD